MARVLDVELDNERIKIEFPYEEELVDVVRTLPERSFDNRTKCWFVPLEHLEYVIRRLEGYHFKFSPRLREFRAENGEGEAGSEAGLARVPDGTWTVSRLNQAARNALRERFDETVWVVGELQDYDKNHSSSYSTYFFDLVERPGERATEVAKIKAVMFDEHRRTIERRLADHDLELADGVSVRLQGEIDLYTQNGRYQLRVQDIDPAYTAGEIELNRERVYRVLVDREIAENNIERSWPTCPRRIGLITSLGSDAYNDFIHQIERSGLGCRVAVHDANVQGAHTERSVVRALNYFRDRADQFDVVAIVRGGGSRSDLAHFDTEKIGEAICTHPLKIVAGIGHQRDTCLVDMIAESTKTPTSAADRIVEGIRGFVDEIEEVYEKVARRAERRVGREREKLMRRATVLERRVTRSVGRHRRRHDRLAARVVDRARGAIERRRRRLDEAADRLERAARACIEGRRRRVRRARRNLSKPRLQRRLDRRRRQLDRLTEQLRKSARRDTQNARERLDQLEQQLRLLDPRRVLERGFALVRNDEGLVASRDEIPVGGDFDVMLGDGVLRARRIGDDQQGTETQSATDRSTPEPVD